MQCFGARPRPRQSPNFSDLYRACSSSAQSTILHMDTERQHENKGLDIRLLWTSESNMRQMLCVQIPKQPKPRLQTPDAIAVVPFPSIIIPYSSCMTAVCHAHRFFRVVFVELAAVSRVADHISIIVDKSCILEE